MAATNEVRTKRKFHIFAVIGLALVACLAIALFLLIPKPEKGFVSVRFLSLTNDSSGRLMASFYATNSTSRLYVGIRSELEIRQASSNLVSVIQVTNVDYLRPGMGRAFAIPCDGWTNQWRINFYFIGQFHRQESIVYESGWKLQRTGLLPDQLSDMRWVPEHKMTNLQTDWVAARQQHKSQEPD